VPGIDSAGYRTFKIGLANSENRDSALAPDVT
jgi:hypothetical protein